MNENRIEEILGFWFGELESDTAFPIEKAKLWFNGGEAFNREVAAQFGADLELGSAGKLNDWAASPRGRLALIILLDQFSRNVFGESPRCFSQDEASLGLAIEGIEKGDDKKLRPIERTFFYIPFEHSEDLEMQVRGVELFTELASKVPPGIEFAIQNTLDYMVRHKKIIERFGRFPHRNKILGRVSLPGEDDFLNEPDSSF